MTGLTGWPHTMAVTSGVKCIGPSGVCDSSQQNIVDFQTLRPPQDYAIIRGMSMPGAS